MDLHMPSPCLQMSCAFGAVCVVKDGGAVCECPGACPPPQEPVCGSDGHTYGSQCQMKAVASKACQNCSFGAICDGQTGRCVCPTECVDTNQPVCGSDGLTYSSECELHVRACTRQLDLKVAAQRECESCGGVACGWGARCVRNRCECPTCHGEPFGPVCGSNGVTYDNACELQVASCNLKKNIKVARAGGCDEGAAPPTPRPSGKQPFAFSPDHNFSSSLLFCSPIDRPFSRPQCGSGASGSGMDGSCEQDRCRIFGGSWDEDAEEDRCVCDFSCHTVPHIQVCGTDGVTYSSECELKKTRCEKQQHLQVYSQGPCLGTPPTGLTQAKHCSQTVYGCCLDNTTAALGVELAGCPSTCQCNPYGSYGGLCDPTTGQCSCKPGVGGLKCDRCEPGFWNFRGIVTENMSGCTPCHCDALGSVRDDCEQMSGLCSCKTGVKGMKCDVCPDGSQMGTNGCEHGMGNKTSCKDMDCKFGASCVEAGGQAHCECPSPDCAEKDKTKVCGSDGVTYADACQLNTIACRQDKLITVKHKGQCSERDPRARPFGTSCRPQILVRRQATFTKLVLTRLPVLCKNHGDVGKLERLCVEGPDFDRRRAYEPKHPVAPVDTWSCLAAEQLRVSRDGSGGSRYCKLQSGTGAATAVPRTESAIVDAGEEPRSVLPSDQLLASRSSGWLGLKLPSSFTPGITSSLNLYEDSGSGEPSGDDDTESSAMLEASGEEPSSFLKYGSQALISAGGAAQTSFRRDNSDRAVNLPADARGCFTAEPPACCGGTIRCQSRFPRLTESDSWSEPTVTVIVPVVPEIRSSCDNSPFGCCPDGQTTTSDPEGTNCPPTMKFSGFLHLDQVEGQELFYTPEMEDPKSELFGETARSIESALNELYRKSSVQKDFKSVRVRNLAPSSSILAFVEVHLDPDTRFTVEDVEQALLKVLRTTKATAIVVRKPVEENIRFSVYGLSTLPFFTTTATTTTISPTTRRPTTSRRTTTPSPVATATATASLFHYATTPFRPKLMPKVMKPPQPSQPCKSHPCQHGGTCEDDGHDFTCICPAGRGGVVCEKVIKYFIPAFGGKSYLAFPTMKAYHTVRIAMEFRTFETTGLLLFNGQNGKKDFLSLALLSGHVQLRFNTGSGTGTLVSRVRVRLGRWHQLVVTRNRRNAMLSVDSEPYIEGESPPGTDGLNLDTDLFVGGVPEELLQEHTQKAALANHFRCSIALETTPVVEMSRTVKERTSVASGLVGCIRTLDVNNMVYSLQENGGYVLYGSAVGECGNNPCEPNPCHNGATCQVKEAEMFHCKCVNGFSESKPDQSETYMPFFTGDSYLELRGLHNYGSDLLHKVSMTVVFLAEDPNGMIFYNGQRTDGRGDFISLALNDGILEFRYDLGKGPAVIRSRGQIPMNTWNTVNLERAGRKGELSINDKDRVRGEAPYQHAALNLKESFFVGGVPDFSKVARAASLSSGFRGAIQKITLMGTPVLTRENALRSRDVSMYKHHRCAHGVCQNGGLCNPLQASYECICQHGFGGSHCQDAIIEKSAGEAESIAFDGHTFIEYHNAVTKSPELLESPTDRRCEATGVIEAPHPDNPASCVPLTRPSEKALLVNRFELSIRTEATHGLILWSGKGTERSDYIALAVVDGRVQMTYDLGSKPVVLQSSVRVDTNRWIRIKASRTLRDGSLQVGNEAAVTGSSPLAATQLDTDGALWLGGLEELALARRLPKAYSTGFVGCVKDVSVDGVELHLIEDALNNPRILHCSAK
ncbi:hypothetical protein Z043_103846 [Scleropages formosus]|uniref:Agrin n=1 Tax=Scleropages formosus TaxID=113540 RepID=A0A0P7VSG7_SCLFO|nr:hypothetical protein Z043_103846 [Scleropages formosus]